MIKLQKQFDIAVITTTTLRTTLQRAIQSVFEQDYKGRVQILVGIDIKNGEVDIIDQLRESCPVNMTLTVIDPGYSTAARNGGLYSSFSGGAMRTILSYAANSRFITYLDDDNWLAPHHISDLMQAVEGKKWAFSLRWLVDKNTREVICEDDFISVGPQKGVFAKAFGGFVDPNCMVMDKLHFHNTLPLWCIALVKKGNGSDQRVSQSLIRSGEKPGGTGKPSVYYEFEYEKYPVITKMLKQRGVISVNGE